ncbi:probable F-box protein [Tanacetum coccineum]
MEAINQVSCFMCSSSSSSSFSSRRDVSRTSVQFPKFHRNSLTSTTNIQKIQPNIGLVEEMDFGRISPKNYNTNPKVSPDILEKLYVILEAVSDRVEMHKNIGEQRNNWNNLMLTSINTITLSAVTMSGIASAITSIPDAPLEAVAGSTTITSLGAVGSTFVASSPHSSWAMVLRVMGGAVGSVVNTIQHGGQVGMVFEMYRSNAGFFKMMQESIESNLNERDVESRENSEVFEMKVALQLGRSLSELRDVAASYSRLGNDIQEFGSKLF